MNWRAIAKHDFCILIILLWMTFIALVPLFVDDKTADPWWGEFGWGDTRGLLWFKFQNVALTVIKPFLPSLHPFLPSKDLNYRCQFQKVFRIKIHKK